MTRQNNYNSTAIQPLEPVKQNENNFYNIPNSTASNLVLDVLGAGVNIADLPERKKQVNHNVQYQVLEDKNKRRIALKNKLSEVTVELLDIEKVTGSNKAAKKLFVLSLIKAGEVGSQVVYPLASNVALIPPDGNDDASGSPLISSLPENSIITSPSPLGEIKLSCFSAVTPVIGWNQWV